MRALPILAFMLFASCGGESTSPAPSTGGGAQPGAPDPDGRDASAKPAPIDASLPPPSANTAAACFAKIAGGKAKIDYDQFKPTINSHCNGTNHQDIAGVEKLVFLGDSVTAGTPPNLPAQYYRTLLTIRMQQKFGATLEVADCSAWGAQAVDFSQGKNQIGKCFPSGVEPKKTLIVWTMGGNDIANWAKTQMPAAQAMVQADAIAQQLRDAVVWLKAPAHFPKGSYVVFGNVHEYTDGTGDLSSCPTAGLAGYKGSYPEGTNAVTHLQELYMKVATDTRSDMVFMLENFCGHGYHHDDATSQCYRGPGSALWLDLTCIHPNPVGHQELANMFGSVIDE